MINPILLPKHTPAHTGPTYRVVSDLITFKAVATDTNGAYSLFEIRTDPGKGMPPHRQRYDDETFWILEGMYTFLLGDQHVVVQAGDYVFVPRSTAHSYTNSGDSPARMLVLTTPGGIHERFFAEAGKLIEAEAFVSDDQFPELSQLRVIAQTYGIEFLLE